MFFPPKGLIMPANVKEVYPKRTLEFLLTQILAVVTAKIRVRSVLKGTN